MRAVRLGLLGMVAIVLVACGERVQTIPPGGERKSDTAVWENKDKRFLARHAVVERDHAAAVHAPGHFVLVLAGRDAAVALDAALRVADEFHSCHVSPLFSRGQS